MTGRDSHIRRNGKRAVAIVLFLCVCLLSASWVRAQKTPSIFKTDKSGSTSAMNMDYINSLESEYKDAARSRDDRKLIRNRLIYIGIEQIDTEFNEYRKKSRKRNDLLQFLFDFLEIGMSTTIGIINGERAKSVIAEALTGFKGTRTAANKNFHLLERQILFNKMVASRAIKLGEIYEKLNEDIVSYPWERARTELKNYFFAGTFDDALGALSIETGALASDAEETLKGIKERAGIVGAPTAIEVEESRTNFELIRRILRVGILAEREVPIERAKGANANAAKITRLEKTKSDVLDDLRALFDLIQADPKLKPLLDKIPEEYGSDAADRTALAAALARIRENKNPTLDDYDTILPKLSDLISKSLTRDPSMAGRLKTILATSETLKALPN